MIDFPADPECQSAADRSELLETFTVDSETDAGDARPDDGVCATLEGTCTLRAAIQEANALAGPDSIRVPAGLYVLTVTGVDEDLAATGDLDITDDLVISGNFAATTIVDGNALDRVLDVPSGVTARLVDLTIQNGDPGGPETDCFSRDCDGFGIRNAGSLLLDRVAIRNNSLTAERGAGTGGR